VFVSVTWRRRRRCRWCATEPSTLASQTARARRRRAGTSATARPAPRERLLGNAATSVGRRAQVLSFRKPGRYAIRGPAGSARKARARDLGGGVLRDIARVPRSAGARPHDRQPARRHFRPVEAVSRPDSASGSPRTRRGLRASPAPTGGRRASPGRQQRARLTGCLAERVIRVRRRAQPALRLVGSALAKATQPLTARAEAGLPGEVLLARSVMPVASSSRRAIAWRACGARPRAAAPRARANARWAARRERLERPRARLHERRRSAHCFARGRSERARRRSRTRRRSPGGVRGTDRLGEASTSRGPTVVARAAGSRTRGSSRRVRAIGRGLGMVARAYWRAASADARFEAIKVVHCEPREDVGRQCERVRAPTGRSPRSACAPEAARALAGSRSRGSGSGSRPGWLGFVAWKDRDLGGARRGSSGSRPVARRWRARRA